MPEVTPDQFMDTEAYAFYGPNYKELKLQYEGVPAIDADPTPVADKKIEQPISEPQVASSDAQETPEEPEEESEDVSLSEVYRDITSTVGAAEADAVHEFMNNNSSQDEISEYMDLLQSGSQDAVAIFQAAKEAKDAGYEVGEGVESSAFSEDISAQVVDRFGDSGQEIVTLNQQLISGQITASQMRAQVLRDPSLLRAALEARNVGLISF